MKRPSTALGQEIGLHRRNGVVVAIYSDDEGTPERRQHGPIQTVRSDSVENQHKPLGQFGHYARVQRVVDIMGRMKSRGTINAAMARAGRRFRSDFDIAQLHGLKAMDMERVRVQNGRGDISDLAVEARRRVWKALEALGGHASPGGQVVWAVLGEQYSLRECEEQKSGLGVQKDRKTNGGILIASLGVLACVYRYA